MIHTSDLVLREMLRKHEGVRSKPYVDTVGKTSIGVGRNLDDVGLSDDEIDLLLRNDTERAFKAAERVCLTFGTLTPNRQRVLVSMAFNMGQTRLQGFRRMLFAISMENWDEAASQMLDSRWAVQVGNRARELSQMMKEG